MSIRAAAYMRFSTDRQRDASIDNQRRECERTAKAAGMEIIAQFEDKGISGEQLSDPDTSECLLPPGVTNLM